MGRRQPPLVRALYYPDRRVEMAAAEALLRIPNSAASLATTRVVEVLRRAVAAEPVARQPAKILVAYFNEDVRNGVAAAVTAAGYDAVKVTTGRELMQRLGQASDIALLIFDEDLPMPGLSNLLGQIRADTFASQLPILLTTAPPNPDLFRLPEGDPRRALLLNDAARREEALRRYTARWPTITVIPGPLAIDAKALQPLIEARLAEPANPALTAAELKAYSERSIKNLARLARGEVPGYDVVPAGPTVLAALRAPSRLTPEGQIAAIEVASRLKGEDAQTVLADVITDAKRPQSVRIAAVSGLIRSIQQFSPLLTRAQVAVLAGVYTQPKLEAPLRSSLAPLLGSLQPSARLSGQMLLEYQPPVPGAPPPKKDK
jgi:CheY-like chemotaxis protein